MDSSWTVTSRDGSRIVVHELGGEGDVLLIAHATGLCGRMYQLLADELADRFRVVALDFRGHGDSSVPTDADLDIDLDWDRMAEDVLAVTEHLGGATVHAFGHSMGGAALLIAESAKPSTFRTLFLFEPIVFPDEASTAGQNVMGDAARRRRVTFDSRPEVLFRYASRRPFNQIQAGCLVEYVMHGFADQPEGGVRLKCPPEVEARVFENGRNSKSSAVRGVKLPTVVAVGHDEPGPNPALFGPPLAEALAGGRLIRYEHLGHFGPLQDPSTIATDITTHADESGPAPSTDC